MTDSHWTASRQETAGKTILKDGGTPVRTGKWQIMINGESYKVVVSEAAKKALEINRRPPELPRTILKEYSS